LHPTMRVYISGSYFSRIQPSLNAVTSSNLMAGLSHFRWFFKNTAKAFPLNQSLDMEGSTQCEQNWQSRFERPLQRRHELLFVVDWWCGGQVA
jgi:hypothetical protein